MVDLDEILNGNPKWEEVAEFFQFGVFHSEHNFKKAIRKYLMTEEDSNLLKQNGISLTDAINYEIEIEHEDIVHDLFESWNKKLGVKAFY